MKGQGENFIVFFIISVMIVLVVVIIGILMWRNFVEESGLYDRFAPAPISYAGNGIIKLGKEIFKAGTKKFIDSCDKFLDKISSYISFDRMQKECSNWYRNCIKGKKGVPLSPWDRADLSEKDLEAINYLQFNCTTGGIERLKKEWEDESSTFREKSEFEKQNLIKNACASILVDKIYKE